MTYYACLQATFMDPLSWAVVVLGLCLAVLLWRRGWKTTAIVLLTGAFSLSFLWAYLFFELNCVELAN